MCISANVRGLRDEWRRGIVGRYLREWGVTVVLLQETMLETCDSQVWNVVGRGHLEGYIALEAVGRSGSLLVAWNETLFAKVDHWVGRHVVAVQLSRRTDCWQWVAVSVYGPSSPALWKELWADILGIVDSYLGIPLLFGGDFNVTLEDRDWPNSLGGWDPGSEQFWACMAMSGLQEMRPSNSVYTWRSLAHSSSLSWLDRFLCSTELLAEFPLADVRALPRPLSDHTPIVWHTTEGRRKSTYFKLDRSTLLGGGSTEAVAQWWAARPVMGQASGAFADKLAELRLFLKSLQRQEHVAQMSR